jgi:L-rhamnose mutarotase
MKTMTCKQLGGACDKAFHANTFEEIAELSKKHGMDMYQIGNEEHLKAMSEMKELMKSPEAMKEWFENRRKEFDALPEGE